MESICSWLVVLGLTHSSAILILAPPIFAPFTELPLAYFGEISNLCIVLPWHIYVVWKLLKINGGNDKVSAIQIEQNQFLLFCAALFCTCYGHGYHNTNAVADLLINSGQSTSTISYGGNFVHFFHEFVSHKILYGGIFLFYVLILNLTEAKLLLISKSDQDSKYCKAEKQFLDVTFSIKHIVMASFHGVLIGAFLAALQMEIIIIIFCIYIAYRFMMATYKSAVHKYMLVMAILILSMLFIQNVIIQSLGMSVLTDEGRAWIWEGKMTPQWMSDL